jgi:hypothetical protein
MILQWFFTTIAIYGICGLIFAIAFVIKGVGLIDEGAQKSSPGFRIIIIPGTIVFWPLLFKKWLNAIKNHQHD